LDLFFNPEGGEEITIQPGTSAVLPTGCRFGVPHGYMLEIKNRSSVAAKRSLVVGACVVDSGYDGEVFVNLHNIGNEAQTLQAHAKIAQAVMVPVVHFRALETHSGDLYGWYPITISERGAGALGSTDGGKNEKA
jgi:dUTP pyrophosphatase